LGEPRSWESEGVQDLTFTEREQYAPVVVRESRARGKGSGCYCGDTATFLSLENGKDYAFLCDGMGSGSAAALTSALATTFLCRLLQAGGRPESALRMLNGFLASRGSGGGESSTTVDLLEIDRISGEANLFKCGAAPTYLLRDGQVTVFASRTAPAGILESLDAERISFTLKKGDVIMQVSDGITGEEEDCPWPADMLRERYDGERERFVRAVLNRAAEKGDDDMTVILTEVRPCSQGAEGISPQTGRVSA
jgi:stage II sporulation protein E